MLVVVAVTPFHSSLNGICLPCRSPYQGRKVLYTTAAEPVTVASITINVRMGP